MNKITILLSCLLLTVAATAQTAGTLKGRLVDTTNKQSLKDASITVLDGKDSTLDVFTLAKEDGSFSVTNITFGAMIVQIRFQGYEPISKKITFSKANAVVDLGKVYMQTAATDLGNVTVTESVVRMKKDTVEFSAGAFKTKPNAAAEDLLKKIPGMEVAKDGTIKSGGEQVQRVLVDGKRFFADDPKMATKNLPPDVIDKIQVFDDLSDQSKFTGFDDGNRVKTINITTRKDKRKGYFGKFVAGIGTTTGDNTESVYDNNFNINRFNGDEQITLLGQANNINKQNFTVQNLGGGRGGGGGGGGGLNFGGGNGASASGVTTTWAGGANYRDAWSKNVDAYGSYSYNNLHTAIDQSSNTRNILTGSDTANYINSVSSSVSRNENHRINFNIEDRIDSTNSLIFRPNITFQNSSPNATSTSVTTGGDSKTDKAVPIYTSDSKTSSYNSGYAINGANLQFRHRFAKRFRTLSFDLNFSGSQNNGTGYNYSVNTFYKPIAKTDTINQFYLDSSRSFTFNPTVSYTEPIAKDQILELRYTYNYNHSTTINDTYRFSNTDQKYNHFDSLYSNSYNYTATSNTGNINYRIQKTKFNLSFGTGIQFTDLTSDNITKNVIVTRSYTNLTPNLNFTYNFTRTKSLRVFYNGRTGQPSTSQLQPITTTTDSINFQIGNPNLKQQFTNSLRVLYTSFDPFTQRIIFATVNASMISNDIQSSVIQNANGGRTSTYVNLGGTYNISGYFNYGFPIKKPKSNLNLQTNINYTQSQSLLNLISNSTKSTILQETVKWTTNLKNNFDMNLSASYMINPVRNTLSPSQNTNYTTATCAADFTAYTNNGWLIASDFDFTHYDNRPVGYNTTVFLITPSIAKQFLKNKAGELRLSCFDLLGQNQAITSSAVGTQFTTARTNNLTRYFMLTFTYNLRNFAGQQQRGGQNNQFRGMMQGMGGGNFGGGNFGGRRGNN